MYKTHHSRTTYGSWDVEEVHGVVARSTFPKSMYKTRHSRTTFQSWDVEEVHAVVARRAFSKSKLTKHTILGVLVDVEMLKNCMLLWCDMSKSKVEKTEGYGALLHVQVSISVAIWGILRLATSEWNIRVVPNSSTTTTAQHTLHSTTPHYTYSYNRSYGYNYKYSSNYNYSTRNYAALNRLHYITLHWKN